jgi:hypothetical protein
MKMLKAAAAAMAGAAALACAGAASAATVYNMDVYETNYSGNLGTVTVSGEGTSTLTFDVSLASDVFYQMAGNGASHEAFWFDLSKALPLGGTTSFTGNVTYSISAPNAPGGASGGDFPTGGLFTGGRSINDFGQGWNKNYDYGLSTSDNSATGSNLNYYGGELTFTVHANDGSLLSLASSTHDGNVVFGGADLRQCLDGNAKSQNCTTGPVGFSLAQQTSAIPEPAVWAMMLVGFGGLGAMLRYRRRELAAA